MNFKYKEKTFDSKTVLKNILFVIEVIESNQHSGLLANEILTSYMSRKKHNIAKTTLADLVKRLKDLEIIRTTQKGNRIAKKNKKDEYSYYCSKYYIDKQRLLFTYAVCSFLENNNTHSLSCKANRNELTISLNSIFDILSDYFTNNDDCFNKLFFFTGDKNNSPKGSLSWNLKFHNILLIYYYLFIYHSLNKYTELQNRVSYNEYLHPFVYNYFLPISEELTTLWNTFFNKDGSPRNIVRDQPNSFPEFIGSPNIWYGYNLTLPEIPSIIWYTDDKIEKEKVFDLKNINPEEEPAYQSRLINQIIEEFNFKTFKPINVYSTHELSEAEENLLSDDFAWYVSTNSSVLKAAKEYLDIINKNQNRKISLKLHVQIKHQETKKKGWRYNLSVSGRHYSQISGAPSEMRNDIDKIKYEPYDLHSASFNVARILNGLKYDVSSDIKNDIEKNPNLTDSNGNRLDRDVIKPLLYRCCFSPSLKYAKAKYKRLLDSSSDKEKEKKKYLSIDTFEALYNYCQKWTGGTESIRNALFFSESLFELCVYSNVVLKSYFHKKENVYDCFYYDPAVLKKSDIDGFCDYAATIVKDHYIKEKLSKKEEDLKYYKLW